MRFWGGGVTVIRVGGGGTVIVVGGAATKGIEATSAMGISGEPTPGLVFSLFSATKDDRQELSLSTFTTKKF